MPYITAAEGHDDDPDYHSYVLWATVCFLATAVGMVLTYLACYYCAKVRASGLSLLTPLQVQPSTVEIGPYPCLEVVCCCEKVRASACDVTMPQSKKDDIPVKDNEV